MPYTFNGIGTRYYGERERAEDGSYITTEWITFVYLPLLPIGSWRVLPFGKGTNYVIHSSQSYQVRRVPLCWKQVRNVYLFMGPILLLVLYFSGSDIQQWFTEDVLKRTPQSAVQLEPPQVPPAEPDLPLSSKDAARACGKVLKLDKTAFGKLDLIAQLSDVVSKSGFTDEEVKYLGSEKDLEEEAFSAYSLAYLTWEKPNDVSRASLDKMVVDSVRSQDFSTLSQADRVKIDAFLVKFKRMMLNAFDLGRHDAKASPCPF